MDALIEMAGGKSSGLGQVQRERVVKGSTGAGGVCTVGMVVRSKKAGKSGGAQRKPHGETQSWMQMAGVGGKAV